MRDYGWVELKDDYWLLKKPLKYNTDPFACKHATMNLLVQLSKEHDKLYLPYSGGTDSSFICLCYKECLEKNLLYKDIYTIFRCNFNVEGKRLQPDWERANHWYDKHINLPSKQIEIDLFSKEHGDAFISTFLKYKYNFGSLIQFYMLSILDSPAVQNVYSNCIYKHSSNYYLPIPNAIPNSIEVSLYEEVAFSCFNVLTFLYSPLIFQKPFRPSKTIYEDYIFSLVGKSASVYWSSFPQLFELAPKRTTASLNTIPETLKVREFKKFYAKNYKGHNRTNPVEEGGRSLPLLLPDGQAVSSFEQTQEFFNGHS